MHFAPSKSSFLWADTVVLEEITDWLKRNPNWLVLIAGHADGIGAKMDNVALGEGRAASVMRYLVAKGIEPDRLMITSYGSSRPACTEKTNVCRVKNRRVQLLIKER